jgi:hypothetical protein
MVVAIWFLAATFITPGVVASLLRPPEHTGWMVNIPVPLLKWRLVEAAIVTLFASLWFDSLGTDGWWLLFLLVGLLATVPNHLQNTETETRRWVTFAAVELGELARYVVAGGLLAWRLS